MIMRLYNYWLISQNEKYAQEIYPSKEAAAAGQIKMSIFPTSTGTQDNILYNNCSFVGLTHDAGVNEKYVIEYNKERLKVAYVQPMGRYKQVFMRRVEQ